MFPPEHGPWEGRLRTLDGILDTWASNIPSTFHAQT